MPVTCHDKGMRITEVASTDLFIGTVARPLQIIRVTLVNDGPGMIRDPAASSLVGVHGAGVVTPRAGGGGLAARRAADRRSRHRGGRARAARRHRHVTAVARARPAAGKPPARSRSPSPAGRCGWSATSTMTRCGGTPRASLPRPGRCCPVADGALPDVPTAFELVRLHLDEARNDPDYKFVLAEIDYLKPYFDVYPQDRADLIALHRGGPDRDRGRQLQRAEHQPDLRGVDDQERRLRPELTSATCSAPTRGPRGCWTRSALIPAIRG